MTKYDMAPMHLAQAVPFKSEAARERALADLKSEGLTISEAIKAVRQVARVSLGQAKEWVSASAAWRSTALSAQALQEEALEVLHEMGSEQHA